MFTWRNMFRIKNCIEKCPQKCSRGNFSDSNVTNVTCVKINFTKILMKMISQKMKWWRVEETKQFMKVISFPEIVKDISCDYCDKVFSAQDSHLKSLCLSWMVLICLLRSCKWENDLSHKLHLNIHINRDCRKWPDYKLRIVW